MTDEAAATTTATTEATLATVTEGSVQEAGRRALANHFTPAQLAALDQVKAKAESKERQAGGAESETASPAPAAAATAAPDKAKAPAKAKDDASTATTSTAAEATTEEIVIDLSEDEPDETTTTTTTEDAPAGLTEDEIKALDDKARKAYLEANKEAAKVRKRAQEAETRAKELEARLKEVEESRTAAGDALPAELNASNSLAHVFDEPLLDRFETDAKNVLALLQRLANDPDTPATYRSTVDGKTYDLSEDPTGYASWAAGTVLDAKGRREQLGVLRSAQDKAKKLQARLKDTPGFAEQFSQITGQTLVNEWPQRRVEAAIGALVTSGQYQLVKRGKGKGSAESAAVVTATTPAKADKTFTSPRKEPAGSMPAGSPAGEDLPSGRLSQLTQQAMKSGTEEAIKALMKAKMDRRAAQRRG